MEITPGLRRGPPPEPLPEADQQLVGRIRDEILDRGPITFARFMELALYDPELGYYRAAQARPGRAGDFLTAPETHPIFGRVLAGVLDEMWRLLDRPDPFVLREYGAGSGTLALAILHGLRADGSALLEALRYEPIEIGERRRAELAAGLAEAGFADRLAIDPPAPETGPGPGRQADRRRTGCVIANEFLDALPVHRFEWRAGQLRELYVDWRDGRFVDHPGPPSTPALAERLAAEGIVPVDGQRGEICLALDGWVAEAAGALERGFVLVIDYGHPASELYGPARRDGTLRAYVRHRVGADPYARVGRQDLTAHVDLTALLRAAARSGLTELGLTTQAEFLVGAGIGERLEAIRNDPATTLADYLELRASLMRLLDPAATGRFRVIALGRDLPPGTGLSAFGYRVRR